MKRRMRLFDDITADRPQRRWEFVRASGDALCEACGRPYYDHPTLKRAHWLTRPCVGQLVKL